MSKTSKAFVIKGYNSKEKDKNILLFSLEEGKIWATLKGVRGDKAKMKYAKEPFCFGEFTIEEGKFSNVVTSVEIIEPFNELAQDVDKYFEGQAVLEIVNSLDMGNEKYPLFVNLLKTMKILAFHKTVKNACLIKFLIEVFNITGHKIGGVCPFALKERVEVYLDNSLKKYETVYPAAGSSNSAIELTIPELEKYSKSSGWVDVCKNWN